ncbi:MAG: hypothetical protein JNL74_24415 [Fibrobacteres bacterium]|nr:hypothetical protein [Fibrobacterota bacterium]
MQINFSDENASFYVKIYDEPRIIGDRVGFRRKHGNKEDEIFSILKETLKKCVFTLKKKNPARKEVKYLSDNEALKQAKKIAMNSKRVSTTQLVVTLNIGYAKAGRIMDKLEKMGIVEPHRGDAMTRKVLKHSFEYFDEGHFLH